MELQTQREASDKHVGRLKVAMGETEELHHKLGILEHKLGEERSERLLKHSEAERVVLGHSHALSQLEAAKSELPAAESAKDHLHITMQSEASAMNQLREQIEQITKSKEVLQRAMLEQLSHARRELREEKERNSHIQVPP